MSEKPQTRNEKMQDLAFSALFGLVLLLLLSGISACVVWGRL